MRWPIRYQILIPFTAAMLIGLLSVSAVSAYLAARRVERQIEEQVRNLGRTLMESNFPLTDSVLAQMHGLSGAEFVLSDAVDNIISQSKSAPSAPAHARPVTHWRQLTLGSLMQLGGRGYFVSSLAMPRRGPQSQQRVLDIFYPEEHWRASRRDAALPPLAIGGATLAIFIAVAAVISVRLERPIARLRAQVARLAQGDFQALTLPSRNDELRDLANSMNVLAEQLAEMRRAIGRAERLTLLGQLSGGLAHHLRNDITGARMAVQLHQRHGCDADDESLAVALRQLKLTEEHVQQFLSAGQPRPIEKNCCDPGEVVQQVAQIIEPICRHRRVELFAGDCHTGKHHDPTRWLEADGEQLRQLLLNLAMNAIEAAGRGGWLRMEVADERDRLILRVVDSGPGVPAGLEDRLFEPFATMKPEGIGLGLAVARQIAQAHQATLTYRREGETTCFELGFPAENLLESNAGAAT